MKRKYLALMLGAALAISPLNVYAATPANAKTEAATEAKATEKSDAQSQEKKEAVKLTGQVTAIDKDTITIALGTLKAAEVKADAKADGTKNATADGTKDATADGTKDATAATEKNKDAKTDTQSNADKKEEKSEAGQLALELNGKEEKLSITGDTAAVRELAADAAKADDQKNAAADTKKDDKAKDTAAAKTDDKARDTAAARTDDKARDTTDAKTDDKAKDASATQTETIKITDVKVGDLVEITCSEDGKSAAVITVLSLSQSSGAAAKANEKDAAGDAKTTEASEAKKN